MPQTSFMRHILSPERIEYKCARDFWRTYPDEPAALAVYLLTMQHTFPPYSIRSELSGGQEEWAAREKLLGFPIPQDMVFGDLTPDMLRPPLLRSLQMARRRGDALFILTLGPLLGELDAIMAQPSVPYVKK